MNIFCCFILLFFWPAFVCTHQRSCAPNTEFYVQLTEDSTRTVMELRGPFTESKANRLRNGMSINLNHNRFSVAVVPKSKVKPETLKACGKV